MNMSQSDHIWRDGQGRVEPGMVVRLDNRVAQSLQDGRVKVADLHSVFHAPTFRPPDEHDVSETHMEPEIIQDCSTDNRENNAKLLSARTQEEDHK